MTYSAMFAVTYCAHACRIDEVVVLMHPFVECCRVDKGVLTLRVSKRAEAARPMYKDIFVD